MGRPEFETVVAEAPKIELQNIDVSQTPVVPAGNTEFVDLYAPSGFIGIIQSAHLKAESPVGGTNGSHTMQVTSTQSAGGYTIGASSYNTVLEYNYRIWKSANGQGTYPTTEQAQNILGTRFDDNISIRTYYNNVTDVDQTGQRTYQFTWIKQEIGGI